MKKIVFLALALTTVTPAVIFSSKTRTISEIICRAVYLPDIVNPIFASVDRAYHGENMLAGTLIATAGVFLTALGIKFITQDCKKLLELWKKFEERENVVIEWRKAPRKIITAFLAYLASAYGLAITYAGCMRFIHSELKSEELIEFCKTR